MEYRLAAFPVGSRPIRVIVIPLQFFEVPPAFRGLGICLRLSGSRRFLSLPRCRTIWLAALGFRAFDSRLQQRTSRDRTYLFPKRTALLCFRAVLSTVFWEYTTSISPSSSSKTTRGRYIAPLCPMAFQCFPETSRSFFVEGSERAPFTVSRFFFFLPAAASSPLLPPPPPPHLLYFLAAQPACLLSCPRYFF